MCFSADERRQIKLCFKNFKFITVKDTINNNERCWKIYYLSFYISFQIKELVHLKCHFQESSLNKKGRTKWQMVCYDNTQVEEIYEIVLVQYPREKFYYLLLHHTQRRTCFAISLPFGYLSRVGFWSSCSINSIQVLLRL